MFVFIEATTKEQQQRNNSKEAEDFLRRTKNVDEEMLEFITKRMEISSVGRRIWIMKCQNAL